jgi:hypothetical protein
MYQPSYLKTKLYPTFQEAQTAAERADRDDINSRDTRGLMAVLMRIVNANPRLRGHIMTRRTALSSFSYSLLAYERSDEQRASEAMLRLGKAIAKIIKYHTDTPVYGAMALRLNWQRPDNAAFAPVDVYRYKPVEIEQPLDSSAQALIVSQGDTIERTPVEKTQSIIFDLSEDTSQVGGAVRPLMFQQILLDIQYKGFAEFNKRLKGLLIGKWKEGTEDENRKVSIEAIKNIGTYDYAVTSDSVTLELMEAVSRQGHLAYEKLIDIINANAAIAILGQANTSELGNNGSRAALQVLKMISADIMYEDMQRVEAMINEQLLMYDFQLNFNQAAQAAPYKFQFNWHEDSDALKEAQVIREVLASGVPLPKSEVYARIGYTMPDETTEIIAATVPSIAI